MTPAAKQTLRQYAKQLMRADAQLFATPKNPKHPEQYELHCVSNKNRVVARIDAAHIENWRREDLLEDKGNAFVLSPTGKAWLRRAQATHSPFMAQHQIRRRARGEEARNADCNIAQTPLEWLRARQKKNQKGVWISEIEYDAGEKLRQDFERAHLSPKMGMDWARPIFVDGGGNDNLGDNVLDARKRVREALAYVGPGLADMVVAVCCHLQGLEDSEAAQQLPRRSGKLMLKLALNRLSIFYGLQSEHAATASFRMR